MKVPEFIKVDEKNKTVTVKINAKVFPIDIIYSAAYSMLDRAYVILDGDPENVVYAILKPRNFEGSLEELGKIFYDELINYAFYVVQSIRNKDIKEAIIRATLPEEESFEDIATIWEEKFGEKVEGGNEEK